MPSVSDKVVAQALRDYAKNNESTAAIAHRVGVAKSTISTWASRARLSRRSPGRRSATEPGPIHKEILRKRADNITMEVIARQMGMTKQNVHRICKRWKDFAPPPTSPFKEGDKIKQGRDLYLVIKAGPFSGVVRSLRTGVLINAFRWNLTKNGKTLNSVKM
jgi:transposase-like protein